MSVFSATYPLEIALTACPQKEEVCHEPGKADQTELCTDYSQEGGCVNDDSTRDTFGDTCSDWYDGRGTSSCGRYDTDDFSANDQCCECGGGTFTNQ